MKKFLIISLITATMFPSLQCIASQSLTPVASITAGGHIYSLYDESMTWNEADEFCGSNGGHLVTITSEAEQSTIELLLEGGSKKQYWIGLLKKDSELNWVTGEDFDYSNWDSGEPNSHSRSDGESEDYIHIYNTANPAVGGSERFKWNDMYYDNTYPGEEDNFGADTVGFICETESVQQATTAESKTSSVIPDDAAEYNGHSYKVYEEKKSWDDAEEYCESMGGHLLTITTQGEQQFIEFLLEDYSDSDYMIGLHRDLSEFNTWVTGEAVSYTNWGANEPDNLGSQSVGIIANGVRSGSSYYIEKGQWDDNGNRSYYFICEWDTLSFSKSTSTWAKTEIQEAYENNLIPEFMIEEDLTQNISRAEFASVSLKLYEALTEKSVDSGESLPFTDLSGISNYSDIQKAYMLDIAVGTSPVTFEPNADINREQLVTMLCRTLKKYKYPEWTIETDNDYVLLAGSISKKFDDDDEISDFARDSVYYMSEMGIVTGVDSTHFAPKNTTDEQAAQGYAAATREQAIALSLRILKKADLL